MKIEKIIKKKSNIYEIILSDKTSLSFYDETIFHYNLLLTKEINKTDLKDINYFNLQVEAYYKALNYIKKKLRTKLEIYNKLKGFNYDENIIKNVLEKLEKQKYLNDELYIKSYINDQVNLTLKGPIKIKRELNNLGFNNIDSYFESIDKKVWENKVQKIIDKNIKSNKKYSKNNLVIRIKNNLVQNGYNIDDFSYLFDNIKIEDNEEIIKKLIERAKKKYSKKLTGKELEYKIKQYMYSKGFNISIDKYL